MIRRLVAVGLTLSVWVGGTVLGSIGGAGPAGAVPVMVLGRAHADYVPAMDGSTPIFVLLLGSDARPETDTEEGLADSIHILGINPAKKKATLFGIPRDAYVPIASGGTNKINTAMSAGGVDNQIATVENLTGITISYYAVTRFEGLQRVVNELGGVTINAPIAFQGYVNYFPEGVQTLKGPMSLEYSRTRKSLSRGDFQRSIHQGVVIQGALNTFAKAFADDRGALYTWLGAGLRHVQTSLSLDELTDLALLSTAIEPKSVTNLVAIGSTGSVSGMSVVTLSSENQALWDDLGSDGYILPKHIPEAARSS